MKREPPVVLQRRMRVPDRIDLPDHFSEAARLLIVAHTNLILFRVEILLAAGAHRHVLGELEPAVNPVRRAQGGEDFGHAATNGRAQDECIAGGGTAARAQRFVALSQPGFGVVGDLPTTLTKFLPLGLSLETGAESQCHQSGECRRA